MKKSFLILPIAAMALSACSSISTDRVLLESMPADADVYVNGELVGKTPYSERLDSSFSHEVVIKKEGYVDQNLFISTVESKPFITFGPLTKADYYKSLSPKEVVFKLKPDFLPAEPEEDKFAGLSKAIDTAMKLRGEGKLGASEYKYVLTTVADFYSPGLFDEVALDPSYDEHKKEDAKAREILSAQAAFGAELFTHDQYIKAIEEIIAKYAPAPAEAK